MGPPPLPSPLAAAADADPAMMTADLVAAHAMAPTTVATMVVPAVTAIIVPAVVAIAFAVLRCCDSRSIAADRGSGRRYGAEHCSHHAGGDQNCLHCLFLSQRPGMGDADATTEERHGS